MEIIDFFTKGKLNNPLKNEDGFFISEDFVVIIDGASSYEDDTMQKLLGKDSTGRVARDSIINSMERLNESNKKITKLELKNLLSADLRAMLPQNNIDFYRANMQYGLEVSVVVYSNYYKEIWFFGDCNVFVNGENKSLPMTQPHIDVIKERVDIVLNRLKSEYYEDVYETDNSFNDIHDSVHRQRNMANKKDGYLVLTGFDINWKLSKTIEVSKGDTIIFTTDGYVDVKETLSETEEQLKKDLEEDPLCIDKLMGMKPHIKGNLSFDDRTYLKFKA